jgi:methyl-accepting chemotaxis protein
MTAEEKWQVRARIAGQIERLHWLILLRWIGLLGLVLATGVATQVSGYTQVLLPPWLLLPIAILYNLGFRWWLRRTERSAWPIEKVERHLHWQAYLQPSFDMVALCVLVYLNGGVECPTLYIPLLAVLFAAIVLPLAGVFIVANLGVALLAIMAVGEYQGWIPHVDFLREPFQHGLYQDPRAILGTLLTMAIVLNLVAFLLSNLGQRLDRAEEHALELLTRLQQQVGDAAGQLARSSGEMRHGAEEVSLVAEQIATTVTQIAQGAGEQAGQLEHLSRNLEHLESAGRRIAEGSQETHQASEDAVATTDRGRQAAQEATTRMQEIARVFAQAEEALLDLTQRSEQIAEVALAIDRFAERTDLLALNAGIEAARAGEHGRGFAVVAGEVKKLAASSSASAEQVAAMVAQVQAEITNVVGSVQAGRQRVHDGQEAIATLREVLDGMAAVITRAAELAGTMEHLSHQQQESYQEIVRAVARLASTAEETAAGAEETAAAVEEQVASFSEFSTAVKELAALANQLDQAVALLYSENDASPAAASTTDESPNAGG